MEKDGTANSNASYGLFLALAIFWLRDFVNGFSICTLCLLADGVSINLSILPWTSWKLLHPWHPVLK